MLKMEFQFTGLPQDTENSSYHAGARNFSYEQGRWLSPDPYSGSYDVANPQSFNRYSYVLNNPVAATDPSGLCTFSLGLSDCWWEDGGAGDDGGGGDGGDGGDSSGCDPFVCGQQSNGYNTPSSPQNSIDTSASQVINLIESLPFEELGSSLVLPAANLSLGLGSYLAGGAVIAGGCFGDPTPGLPATCYGGIALGTPLIVAGTGFMYGAYWSFKNVTLPILEQLY